MKRIFVILSNLLASLFFVWILTIWADSHVSYYYQNVAVFDSSLETTFERVAETSTKLADDSDSLIAMQHQEPGINGVPVFTYTIFGEGYLPDALSEMS